MRRLVIVAGIAATLATGCGNDAAPPDPVVAVEAQWLCDVPRYAFPDAGGTERLLTDLLAEADVSRADYDEFKAALDHDAELRASVAVTYDALCGGV